MEKITFVNGSAPALNATNLNQLQTNVENAAIVESGSNTNGSWIKFGDGTMMCRKRVSHTFVTTDWTPWGSIYEGSIPLGNYSQTFIEIPDIHCSNGSGAGWWIESIVDAGSSSIGTLWVNRPTAAGLEASVCVLAIGKWK